jgi:hypothetical protein
MIKLVTFKTNHTIMGVVEERPEFAQELQARRLEIKEKYPKE